MILRGLIKIIETNKYENKSHIKTLNVLKVIHRVFHNHSKRLPNKMLAYQLISNLGVVEFIKLREMLRIDFVCYLF